MAPSKTTSPLPLATSSQPHYYTVLPPQPQDENYTILPYYYLANPRRNWCATIAISLILLAALLYVFWPSEPELKIERLHLAHFHVRMKPAICIDISLNVTLKVHNRDVYSVNYKSLDVSVGYRGRKLGHVKSNHGRVKALASSYIDAELQLKCVKVLSDVVYLLEDLARGTVPFDTITKVTGHLGLFFLEFPLEVKWILLWYTSWFLVSFADEKVYIA